MDDIAAKTGNYETARTILNSSFDNVISEGYSFFYDGTCRNKGQILRRMGALKEQGYEIILGITYAPMKTALRRIEARTHQPLDASIAKEIYIHVQNSIEQFMKSDIPDEVYLYNNTDSTKLIYHRKNQKVYCDTPNSKFYFKVC